MTPHHNPNSNSNSKVASFLHHSFMSVFCVASIGFWALIPISSPVKIRSIGAWWNILLVVDLPHVSVILYSLKLWFLLCLLFFVCVFLLLVFWSYLVNWWIVLIALLWFYVLIFMSNAESGFCVQMLFHFISDGNWGCLKLKLPLLILTYESLELVLFMCVYKWNWSYVVMCLLSPT